MIDKDTQKQLTKDILHAIIALYGLLAAVTISLIIMGYFVAHIMSDLAKAQ